MVNKYGGNFSLYFSESYLWSIFLHDNKLDLAALWFYSPLCLNTSLIEIDFLIDSMFVQS